MTQLTLGLQRQDAFVDSIKKQNFDFGLVFTQAFLKGIRDIGYKSTATALFESIDNSIQAEASNIYVILDTVKGKSEISRIAIVDDGHGMSPEMARVAVLWGGSDRIDNREGMGKYGYGLPSSCVSIGTKFSVYSKREDMKNWYSVPVDIEEIGEGSEKYKDPNTGRIIAPEAKQDDIPTFVQSYLNNRNVKLGQGTIVVIEKIDRLSYNSLGRLKPFLVTQTGVTYRNYLRLTNIYIDDMMVEPIDPLFTTEGFKYYDEDDERAEALPPLEVNIKGKGIVKARFSYMGPTFLRRQESKATIGGERNKRFPIRKENNGIIVLRAGRQIDVINAKCPWTTFQNNDRYIGIELDFNPTLDEYFSVTTAKQQIVIQEHVWDILRDNGVWEAIQEARKRFHKASKEHKDDIYKSLDDNKGETFEEVIENVFKESANNFEVDKSFQPQHVKKEAAESFDSEVKKKAKQSGLPENVVRQHMESEIEAKPFKIEYFDEEEGPFFRPKQIGGQVVIYINKAHRFYTDLFDGPQTTLFSKKAFAIILFALGHSELRVTEERRKWYQSERQHAWSNKLETSLEILSDHLSATDDEVFEEEMEASTSED